jgi:cbb3-type cytochrome oxidase maturation protein
MEILFFLVPLAVLMSALGLGLFFLAVGSGQFEDLDGDGARFLLDPGQESR